MSKLCFLNNCHILPQMVQFQDGLFLKSIFVDTVYQLRENWEKC